MSIRAVFLKLFSCAVAGLSLSPADAAQVEYSSINNHQLKDFHLETPIQQVGNLPLASAWVRIQGSSVELSNRDQDSFTRQVVLSGRLLKTRLQIRPDSFDLQGLVYFDAGPWLGYITYPNSVEVVFLEDGFKRGQIVGADSETLRLRQSAGVTIIPWSQVKDVRSPQFYACKIQARGNQPESQASLELKETVPLRRLQAQSVIGKKALGSEEPIDEVWWGQDP